MKKNKNTPAQYRKVWTKDQDIALAGLVTNVLGKGGSKAEACKTAARELARPVEGTKTRYRALCENTTYFRRYGITDNGVRVRRINGELVPSSAPVAVGTPIIPNRFITPRTGFVTITIGGQVVSGTSADLCKILGISHTNAGQHPDDLGWTDRYLESLNGLHRRASWDDLDRSDRFK